MFLIFYRLKLHYNYNTRIVCCLLILLVQLSCQKIIKVSSCPSLKRARNQNQVILVAQKISALYKMRCCCCVFLCLIFWPLMLLPPPSPHRREFEFSRRKILSMSFCHVLTCGKTVDDWSFIVAADFYEMFD